jgi:hypothetical protein
MEFSLAETLVDEQRRAEEYHLREFLSRYYHLSLSRFSLRCLYILFYQNGTHSQPHSISKPSLKRRAEQPEWWTAQAIPWYHYIPLKYDYTDLWDVLAFLDGAPDGASSSSTSTGSSSKEEEEEEEEQEEEEKEVNRARRGTRGEGVAEEIAKRGMQLSKENLRCVSAFFHSFSFSSSQYRWKKRAS